MIKSIIILFVTILGYILQNKLNIALPVIALSGAFLLLIVSKKEIKVEKIFESIQWSTLFFLAGLFMVVHGLNESGVLDIVAQKIAASTNNFALLLIIIIWASGIISMIVDNTAFVTVMVPIILALQNHFQNQPQLNLMWWALSLGAVFGGNGTIIGTAANVVGTDIARKFGLNINFNSFLRYGLPFAFLPLSIASLYILIRFYYI
ncbi:anion permease [Candidatus Peregrinibacteria bacterium]|nr:anion permease [Candidatus Peregrinibacteria bacterium]